MRYIMKSGSLFRENTREAIATVKRSMIGPARKIYGGDGILLMETDCRFTDPSGPRAGDVRQRAYVLTDAEKRLIALAQPEYAEEDDPRKHGWPLCRLPKVDHANITLNESHCILTMQSSLRYYARDLQGTELLSISHQSITGGWLIEDHGGFSPGILCGLFVFSRYIEQENEFLIV